MVAQNETYFDISPKALNYLEGFKNHPNEVLEMLQIATNYNLTSGQWWLALVSAWELADVKEINMLDLVELWQNMPALSIFAAHLHQVFLPGP